MDPTILLEYTNKGHLPDIKQKIIDMAMNGSGIRDTSRVLGIGQNTVISELKKKEKEIQNVNYSLLKKLNCEDVRVKIICIEEAEIDEIWSFVKNK